MIAPDLTKVDAAQQSLCMTQWEHFRFDLLALGVELTDMPNVPPVAGQSGAAGASGSPPVAAGAPAQAGREAAGAAARSGGTGPEPKGDSGCSVSYRVGANIDSSKRASEFGKLVSAAAMCALALFFSRSRSRGRGRSRSRSRGR
jgi:hypothetical protein